MAAQICFEDVKESTPLPPLRKPTSTRLSALWAAASGDFDPIHYDKEYALAQKLPAIIVNGRLKLALLVQLVTNFMGPAGRLRKISLRHQSMDLVGRDLILKGVITRKLVHEGESLIECELWVENPDGEKTSIGSATIGLPLREPQGG
jgi:acyl dehydratase